MSNCTPIAAAILMCSALHILDAQTTPESAATTQPSTWSMRLIDRLSERPIAGAEVIRVTRSESRPVLVTDARGRLQEPIADATSLRVRLPVTIGGIEIISNRADWKQDERGRFTVAVDAYARLVISARCGDGLCKMASIEAFAIPPIPDSHGMDEHLARLLRILRSSDPLSYRGHLKTAGLLGTSPEIERETVREHSAELFVPYDGDVCVGVSAVWTGTASVVVQTKRGTSQRVDVKVGTNPSVSGVVLNADGTPAAGVPVHVATRASFPDGDLTPTGASMLIIKTMQDGNEWTIHYRSLTDVTGHFSLPVNYTGEICAYAFGPGGRVNLVAVKAKSLTSSVTGIDLRLPGASEIPRRMRFVKADGTPLANAGMRAEIVEFVGSRSAADQWSIAHPLRTDAEGWADVSGLNHRAIYDFELDGATRTFGRARVVDDATVTGGAPK